MGSGVTATTSSAREYPVKYSVVITAIRYTTATALSAPEKPSLVMSLVKQSGEMSSRMTVTQKVR